MSANRAPAVFISYAHVDKRVARRIAGRFTAHGIRAWLDERELRIGAALTSSIRSHIENADAVLVIASQASATSLWVGLEVEFARKHEKTVIPFFIEPVSRHERFRDHLGVDATRLQNFADAVHGLMCDLYTSLDLELPAPDAAVLTTVLRELARQEPSLAPLIEGALDSEGLHGENLNTVRTVAFHALDEALDALSDTGPTEKSAYHAAYGFKLAGAGARALRSWIDATGDGGLPLVSAVGSEGLDAALIPTALELLGACSPPNNHALYNFIHHNARQLDDEQRRSAIRLVTWPIRADTDRLGDVLGWVALRHFPDAEIRQMWARWIRSGSFDGRPSSPGDLARYLVDADKEDVASRGVLNEALRGHVRAGLRSGDRNKVMIATDHIMAAADEGARHLASLLQEAEGVSGTAEWDAWSKRDAAAAREMQWWVFEVVQESSGERNWLRAWESARRMVGFEEQAERARMTAE